MTASVGRGMAMYVCPHVYLGSGLLKSASDNGVIVLPPPQKCFLKYSAVACAGLWPSLLDRITPNRNLSWVQS